MKTLHAIGLVVAGLALTVVAVRAQSTATPHDTFYFIGEINKASIVMLAETGIVPRPLASRIARGIRTAIDSQAVPGAPRPTDYFDFEPMVIAAAGPDASRMHTGRSRQDIESTYQRDYAREALLADFEALNESRAKLLALAVAIERLRRRRQIVRERRRLRLHVERVGGHDRLDMLAGEREQLRA